MFQKVIDLILIVISINDAIATISTSILKISEKDIIYLTH
jgi:hypothetical protein